MKHSLHRPLASLMLVLGLGSPGLAQNSLEQLADVANGRDANSLELRKEEDQRERMRYLNDEQQKYLDKAWIEASANVKDLVVLPPMPWVLAENRADFPAVAYPETLIDYAGETFFMPHGSLRFRRQLKSAQIQRLDQYRATRDALATALRAKVAGAGSLEPEALRRSLTEFATTQQAALQKLEAEAEAIRTELTALDSGAAVAKQRDSEGTLKTAGLRNYLAALLAAQFAGGLSTEQRQLLQEVALESVRNRPAGDRAPAGFFLPSPARVRWPELPEAAATILASFDRLRQELKDELVRAVVYDQDSKLTPAMRTAKYAALASRQAPQFAELQRLAEELRLAAASLPYPDRPAPSELPPDLVRQVGTAVASKNAFQVAWSHRFQDLSRQFPPARFKLAIERNQPVIQMFSMQEANAKARGPSNALLLKLAEYKAQIERDYPALATEMEAARAAVQRFRETLTGDEVPEVSQLTAAFAQVYDRDETWRRAADYYTAVLTPGLSPAQRRLLLGAALRDLEKYRLATMD